MKYTSPFDFLHNAIPNGELHYYTIVDGDIVDSAGPRTGRVIVVNQPLAKPVAENATALGVPMTEAEVDALVGAAMTREYAVIEKVKASNAVVLDKANTVYFKARFVVKDNKTSPVLEGYKIKLGE